LNLCLYLYVVSTGSSVNMNCDACSLQVTVTSVHAWCSSALMEDPSEAFPYHVDQDLQWPVWKAKVVVNMPRVGTSWKTGCWKESHDSTHVLTQQTRQLFCCSCLALCFWLALVCRCVTQYSIQLQSLNHRCVRGGERLTLYIYNWPAIFPFHVFLWIIFSYSISACHVARWPTGYGARLAIDNTPIAWYSLFVLKVPLNTK